MITPRSRLYRLLAFATITVGSMSYTLIHIFEEVKPFDWLMLAVEVLVLGLIAYEVVVARRERRAKRKREALLAERLSWLSGIVEEGEQLRRTTPHGGPSVSDEQRWQWVKSVDLWTQQTTDLLAEKCPKSAIAFGLVKPTATPEAIVYPPNHLGAPFQVVGNTRVSYLHLVARLGNLTEIMEKVDFYF